MRDGVNFSIDESCLASKIFMGHVYSLIGRCDYILIPRVVSYGTNNSVCTKFNALYDIVKNTFDNVKILDYNIDAKNGKREAGSFIRMGKALGSSCRGHFSHIKRPKGRSSSAKSKDSKLSKWSLTAVVV